LLIATYSSSKRKNASSLEGTRREPRGTTLLGEPLTRPAPSPAPTRASRYHGRTRPRLLGLAPDLIARPRRRSGGGSGMIFTGAARRTRTLSGSLEALGPGYSFPSSPVSRF